MLDNKQQQKQYIHPDAINSELNPTISECMKQMFDLLWYQWLNVWTPSPL